MKKILILVSMMLTSLVFCGCKEKINLNDYLEIEIDGYDTVGTATYTIDYDEMYDDYEDVFDKKVDGEIDELISFLGTEMLLMEAIDGELSKSTGLSNGDTVKFSWDINAKKVEEAYKVKFVYEDVEEKVKGLEKGTIFNPFDEIKVSFSGISPNGRVDVVDNFSVSGLEAAVDKSSGLRNGDTVTVTIQGYFGSDVYETCFESGMIPEEIERSYIVSGLSSYVETLSEIPKDALSAMETQANDELEAHIAEEWIVDESLKDMELIGQYFLSLKPGLSTDGAQNEVILVFRNTVENSEGAFSYYYYISYFDLMLNEDKTLSYDVENYTVPVVGSWVTTGTTFTRGSYYYTGYETLEGLFNDLVQEYSTKYNYETNISDEILAESKEQFISEKGELVSKFIIDGESTEDVMENSDYYDEVLNYAKEIAAEQFYTEQRYTEAYKLYEELGMTEKCEELATLIYEEAKNLSAKEAFDNVSEGAGTYIDEEEYKKIEDAYLKEQFKNATIGDVLLFGNYEQDNNQANGKESIEWIVIDKTDDKVTLLSKYMIERYKFDEYGGESRWDYSSLRKYLNGDFFDMAFSAEEQKRIATTLVRAEKNPEPKYYDNDPGEDTEDCVYILSYGEYSKYKSIKGVEEYLVSEYVLSKGSNWYYSWIRTPSEGDRQEMSILDKNGNVGLKASSGEVHREYDIRPVITIDFME